ncbi:MAG: hypothetical protein KGH60_04155 [Candidatus Micrarchaeota archaeon]|nr:hypothetical protein [Candidatus Micrarchaeota archaeon]
MSTVIVGRDAGPDSRSLENAVRYAVEAYPNLKALKILTHDHDCGGALIKWNMIERGADYGSKMRTRVDQEDIEFMHNCEDFVKYQSTQGSLQRKRLIEILAKFGKKFDEDAIKFDLISVPPKDHTKVGDLCISAPTLGVRDPKEVETGYLLCMDNRLNPTVKRLVGDWYFAEMHHEFDTNVDFGGAYHVQSIDPYELLPDIRAAVEVIGSRRIVVLPPEGPNLKAVFEDFAKELEKAEFIVKSEIKVEVATRRSKSVVASASR